METLASPPRGQGDGIKKATLFLACLPRMAVNYLTLRSTISYATDGSQAPINSLMAVSSIGVTTWTNQLAISTLTASSIAVSAISMQSTVISLGQSTNQAFNNFSGGSYTAGWVSTLSTTASTAGANLTRVQKVTMSQSGQYQLAVQSSVSAYSVVKSSDSGVTWQTLTNGANGLPNGALAYPQATATGTPAYTSVSYSATGQYALASVSGGLLYVSNNATAATPTFTAAGMGAPYIYLPLEGAVTDVMGNSASSSSANIAYTTGVVGTQSLNLVNTTNGAGGLATAYYRGTIPTNMTNFTVSGWFNMQTAPSSSGSSVIFSIGNTASSQTFFDLRYCNALSLNSISYTGIVCTFYNPGSTMFVIGTQAISINTWYNFAIQYSTTGTVYLYINNVLIGSVAGATLLNTTTAYSLGCIVHATNNAFNGYIDDVRIYNSAVAFSPIVPANWSHTAVSATGQYMLAAAAGGGLFQSTNFGQTWSQVNALLNGGVWTSLSINASGQYALATTSAALITPNLTGLVSSGTGLTASWSTNGVSWAVSASSVLAANHPASNAFNNEISGAAINRWATPTIYTAATGAYAGSTSTTIQGVGAVLGEWIQLSSSVPLVLPSYTVSCGGNITTFPKIYYLVGSNDGSTWFPLQFANITTTPFTTTYSACSTYLQVNVTGTQSLTGGQTGIVATTAYSTSTQAYIHFRMVITNITAPSTLAEINELYFNFVGGLTYTSNYGQTWSNNNFLGTSQSFSAISGDGQYALTGTGQTAYLISNYIGLATQSYTAITLPSINANINCASSPTRVNTCWFSPRARRITYTTHQTMGPRGPRSLLVLAR